MTSKAPYTATSNLAVQSPIAIHLDDPTTSKKDKQVYRYHEQSLPRSSSTFYNKSRDQIIVLTNGLDHGKAQHQRSPTLDQAQNIRHYPLSTSASDERQQDDIVSSHFVDDSLHPNRYSEPYITMDEKSAYGDPIVLPRSYIRPNPSPHSACSAQSSQLSSHLSTSYSKIRHHFFKSSSASSMSRLQKMSNGYRRKDIDTEKASAYTRSDQNHSSQPQLHTRHSMMLPALPDFEVEAYCPECKKYVMTRIRYRSGTGVWLFSFVL
ncbi:hypothetical protein NQZ79_g4170 [Umbelopsis isabellina]|nr:hypothetical protein NQZ79_g4170 [Umbelopsis isabellina]